MRRREFIALLGGRTFRGNHGACGDTCDRLFIPWGRLESDAAHVSGSYGNQWVAAY